jgi:3',5'-cyclic AMP phosphodiesterase CpdA
MRLIVLSDLHACAVEDYGKDDSSYYSPLYEGIGVLECPIRSLKLFIEEHQITADFLICPGDIIHQAKPEGLQSAWTAIQEIASAVKAKHVIATAGNHDLDSRHKYSDFDPKGELQSVSPLFPCIDEHQTNEYWARNLTVIQTDEANIVVLNSCAYHGWVKEEEQKHGRISAHTIRYLEKRLCEMKGDLQSKVNILLCHHHPQPVPSPNANDFEDLKGGANLLTLLNQPEFGSWLIIHGHIHYPYVEYARGTTSAPVIFSAGSVAAKLYKELKTTTRNQFYTIDVVLHSTNVVVGSGRAYNWGLGHGWKDSEKAYGIAPNFGFGIRTPPAAWISQIADVVETFLEWDELVALLPDLRFLTQGDLDVLKHRLKNNIAPAFRLVEGASGVINQIVKLP